jgi:ABC-type nitrate/sulfonate/bicarbonate transport system substrate-binding protein
MITTAHQLIQRLRRSTRRRTVLLSLSGVLVGLAGIVTPTLVPAASAVRAGGMTTNSISYQLGWITNTEFAGTYLAQTQGYDAANGLKVTILPGGSDPVEPVVASGKALVGDSNADTVAAAVAAGAQLRIIGARYQINPFCIISSASAPIKNPQELIGKSVGVNTYNLTAWNVFLALNHIKSTQVKTVDEGYSLGPTPLINGQVQAWMGFSTNEPGVLTLAGFKNHSFLMSNFGYHVYADVYETSVSDIATHRAELVAFMKSEIQGWTYDISAPAAGTHLTVVRYEKKLGFSSKQQSLENKAQIKLIVTPYTKANGLFSMSPGDIAANIATLKFAQSQGVATYYTNPNLFDGSILKQAEAELAAGK